MHLQWDNPSIWKYFPVASRVDHIQNAVLKDLLACCRYPGMVHSLSAFSASMTASADLQATIPLDRWDADGVFSVGPEADKIYARFAATMSGPIAEFDTATFGLTKAEATATDAQVSTLHAKTIYVCIYRNT